MLRPPIHRAMRVLDRSLFSKKIAISAATVFENKNISKLRGELVKARDVLPLERLHLVRPDDGVDGSPERKCILLKPEIEHDNETTWTPKIRDLLEARHIKLRPYDLELDYEYWSYYEIMSSILPEDEQNEIPSGFTITGHVAHLNLRDEYLPYKHLIARVILDKNSQVKTVINKTDDVGTLSEYRTFTPEILDGQNNLNVIAHESDCEFRFNYAEVYWNSRLSTEHRRILSKFQKGEAVCDAMAGVGPFAVPAGKNHVFAWANDLNPHGYASLNDAIKRNRVGDFVLGFNEDARDFIKKATKQLLESPRKDVPVQIKSRRNSSNLKRSPSPRRVEMITQPKTFSHFVMNLPASATTFLDAFIGLYAGQEHLFFPNTETMMPMIHVYCFSTKSKDFVQEKIKICEEISSRIGHTIKPDDPDVDICNVRDVAPKKVMFCASFRLPKRVAFKKEVMGA